MAGPNVLVESRGLLEKFKRLEYAAYAGIKAEVKRSTEEAAELARRLASTPVTTGKRGQKVRSRPGQSARSDTGRLKRSIKTKLSPKGWVGTITTSNEATDKKGKRYPWMLESGTRTVKKRPLFKKVKKEIKKTFKPRVGRAMLEAIRKANG